MYGKAHWTKHENVKAGKPKPWGVSRVAHGGDMQVATLDVHEVTHIPLFFVAKLRNCIPHSVTLRYLSRPV